MQIHKHTNIRTHRHSARISTNDGAYMFLSWLHTFQAVSPFGTARVCECVCVCVVSVCVYVYLSKAHWIRYLRTWNEKSEGERETREGKRECVC